MFSRRGFLKVSLAGAVKLPAATGAEAAKPNVHDQILEMAAEQEKRRRARFQAVRNQADLTTLQAELRQKFLNLLDGLPDAAGTPAVRKLGRIEGDEYTIDKLVYESFPGYFVSALLYKPKKHDGPAPAVLSPCGHSPTGKAEITYQILHINLAKRGMIVLTYDPVGQGERSQFWDAANKRSRFNLTCGEHAVLGNPLYLLGTSLARYRIWDGMRGIDYLTSLPEVDGNRIGCIGNSGGGTLTAYIAALDPRVHTAVISCYITTLPRRMGNRIQEDPSSDPEQDPFEFVSQGIDHAGLLALRTPRPTLVDSAIYDFFPIDGARESFAEAKHLYQAAQAADHLKMAEAAERHGLTLPLREAAYHWFDRWFFESLPSPRNKEIPVVPRPAEALLVSAEGQVNLSLHSRPLLPLCWEVFKKKKPVASQSLRNLLRLDPAQADFRLTELFKDDKPPSTLVLCINGNETAGWSEEKILLAELARGGVAVALVDPRGVGSLRVPLQVKNHDYADPLNGVEENIAYNAFLVGKSLLGMRVTDVMAAVKLLKTTRNAKRIVLCGRRDAAVVACLAAAVDPSVQGVAVEEMALSWLPLFAARGQPINAASILPGILRDFGDMPEVLREIAPRKVLAAGSRHGGEARQEHVATTNRRFTQHAALLLDWLRA